MIGINRNPKADPTTITPISKGDVLSAYPFLQTNKYIVKLNDVTPIEPELQNTVVDFEEYYVSGGPWDYVYYPNESKKSKWITVAPIYIGYSVKETAPKYIKVGSTGSYGGIYIPRGFEFDTIQIQLPESEYMELEFYVNYNSIKSLDTNSEIFGFTFVNIDNEAGAVWNQGRLRFQKLEATPYVTLRSDATLPSPVKLTIYGPCVNPCWFHYVNGKKKCYGQVTVSIDEGQWIEINTMDAQRSIMLYGDGSSGTDIFDKSAIDTERFIKFENGLNKVVVTSASGYPRFKIEGMEYYGSI